MYLVLENIMNYPNVGAFFSIAYHSHVKKLYLCGETVQPHRVCKDGKRRTYSRVSTTSKGTDLLVDYEIVEDIFSLIDSFRNKGYRIVALEQTDRSISHLNYSFQEKSVLIAGNEVEGVTPEVIDLCDDVVEICHQHRRVVSLNVAIATSILVFRDFGEQSL